MKSQHKIATFVPKGMRTGGPEAMHQLHYELLEQGAESVLIARPGTGRKNLVTEYSIYRPKWISIWQLKRSDVVIIPNDLGKVPFYYLLFVSRKKIFNWMLAVDFAVDDNFRRYESKNYPLPKEWQKFLIKTNFLGRVINKILSPYKIYIRDRKKTFRFKLKFDKANYLFQSAYARETFRSIYKVNTGFMVTDYINVEDFRDTENYTMCKCIKRHVVYFPSKSQVLMELILKVNARNHNQLHFISMKNLPKGHVVALLSKADLYLDLGFFPGKDRMPREAILLDCPVMLARRGSARYHEDFPIPDKYLLDLAVETPDSVHEKLLETLIIPKSDHITLQAEFKNNVMRQKSLFREEVKGFLDYLRSQDFY